MWTGGAVRPTLRREFIKTVAGPTRCPPGAGVVTAPSSGSPIRGTPGQEVADGVIRTTSARRVPGRADTAQGGSHRDGVSCGVVRRRCTVPGGPARPGWEDVAVGLAPVLSPQAVAQSCSFSSAGASVGAAATSRPVSSIVGIVCYILYTVIKVFSYTTDGFVYFVSSSLNSSRS